MSKNFLGSNFRLSDTAEALFEKAMHILNHSQCSRMGVQHLTAAITETVREADDTCSGELAALKKLISRYAVDIEYSSTVIKDILDAQTDFTLENIEEWHDIVRCCEELCNKRKSELITADIIFESILRCYKNEYVSDILFGNKYLNDQTDLEQRLKELEEKIALFDMLIGVVGDVTDSDGVYDTGLEDCEDTIDPYGCSFEDCEGTIDPYGCSTPDEDKYTLIDSVLSGLKESRWYYPHVFSGITDYIESFEAEDIYGENRTVPVSVLLTNLTKAQSEAVIKIGDCPFRIGPSVVLDFNKLYTKEMLFGQKSEFFELPGLLSGIFEKYPKVVLHIKNPEYAGKGIPELLAELITEGGVYDECLMQRVSCKKAVIFVQMFKRDVEYRDMENFLGDGLLKDDIFDILGRKYDSSNVEIFRGLFNDKNTFAFNTPGFENCVTELYSRINSTTKCACIYDKDSLYSVPAAIAMRNDIGFTDNFFKDMSEALGGTVPRKINLSLDLASASEEVCRLFDHRDGDFTALFFTEEEPFEDVFLPDNCNIIMNSDYNSALMWLNENSPDMVIIDLSYGLTGIKTEIRSLEDIKTDATRLIRYINQNKKHIPIYVLMTSVFYGEDKSVSMYYEMFKKSREYGIRGELNGGVKHCGEIIKLMDIEKNTEYLRTNNICLDSSYVFSLSEDKKCFDITLTDLKLIK